MKKRQLGGAGPWVGAIGLGCMSFGGTFGATDTTHSLRCLSLALEQGIDFWDTANIYGMGVSESVIGQFLTQATPQTRAKVKLATKASIVTGPARRFDNSAPYLRAELLASMQRLRVDYVDLFYIHRREVERPIEEVAGVMADFIREGLIGGYGLSEVSPGTLRRAHRVHPCMAVQNEYSLWSRQPELGLIQACLELGVAFVPFSPLARGVFGQSDLNPTTPEKADFRRNLPRFTEPDWSLNRVAIAPFRAYCAQQGWALSAAALAWILDQGPHLIPIPGTRYGTHVQEWIQAFDIAITPAVRADFARLLPVGFAYGDRYNLEMASTVERYC